MAMPPGGFRSQFASQRVASLAAPVELVFVVVFIFGSLLVVGRLVAPAIMPLAWFILEPGDDVSVELLGLF